MVGTGSQDLEGNELAIPLDVPNLAKGVKTGNRVLLDDGHLE
jgi:pyruvate kinase